MRRRELLIGGALGVVAGFEKLQAKAPDIAFPAEPRERLAVASYPFRDEIESPEARAGKPRMALNAFPKMVVERFNLHRIEPLSNHFPSTKPEYLKQFNDAIKAAGVTVVNIPVSTKGSFYDPDTKARLAAVADAKSWIDTAVALRCPSVRVNIEGVKNLPPDAELATASLKSVAAYGQSRNVVVNLENDDPVAEDAVFIVKLIEQVNSPYLRALPDFCNSMLIGDGSKNYDAVRAMFGKAYNISHVKDSEVDGDKTVHVDVARTFGIAKEAGYKGFFSMEWEGGGDPYAGTQKLIELSLRSLS